MKVVDHVGSDQGDHQWLYWPWALSPAFCLPGRKWSIGCRLPLHQAWSGSHTMPRIYVTLGIAGPIRPHIPHCYKLFHVLTWRFLKKLWKWAVEVEYGGSLLLALLLESIWSRVGQFYMFISWWCLWTLWLFDWSSLTEVGSIIDQVSSWKILWKLSHIEVVLPGGLLLPPPEVNFGVVGIWDIPEDQAQGSSSVTLSKDVVENLWSVHTQ